MVVRGDNGPDETEADRQRRQIAEHIQVMTERREDFAVTEKFLSEVLKPLLDNRASLKLTLDRLMEQFNKAFTVSFD
jgi:hypothetical protein